MSWMNLKRIAVTGAISGALGMAAVGLGAGAGVANATPATPMTGPMPMTGPISWTQDKDDDWDDWKWKGPRGHRGGDWDGDWGPVGWPGRPGGCVTATDPSGLVTGTWCI